MTTTELEVTTAPVLSVTWSLKFQTPVAVEPVVTKLKLVEFKPAAT